MARRAMVVLAVVLAGGCTTIKPTAVPGDVVSEAFSHEDLNRVLERFVDGDGLVDYVALLDDPIDLERYYGQLALVSPDSHSELFPTEVGRLAYWVNAYNAAALTTVLAHYPIESVLDVRPPFGLGLVLPRGSGFFVFQRIVLGGEETSLYGLENDVVRSRFGDPRIHFALNCASLGCPRLPQHAFTAEHLHEELDREARLFVQEPRNVRIDHEEEAIYLSSIFDWYDADFLDWYSERFPGETPSLTGYVAHYLPEEAADELRRAAVTYRVRFIRWDWALNDQRGAESP